MILQYGKARQISDKLNTKSECSLGIEKRPRQSVRPLAFDPSSLIQLDQEKDSSSAKTIVTRLSKVDPNGFLGKTRDDSTFLFMHSVNHNLFGRRAGPKA